MPAPCLPQFPACVCASSIRRVCRVAYFEPLAHVLVFFFKCSLTPAWPSCPLPYPPRIKGGFPRDAVQGRPGNDIDLTFITGKEGIKKMAEVAREKGWTHSCQTPNQKRRCTCAGKGGNGWSYLDCTCERAPTWDPRIKG